MNKNNPATLRLLEDPDFFQAAVNFTAQRTAFAARLIERDYFCSLLLEFLASASASLVFKGGTCLAKVYAEFYRLSEDLDFVISMPIQAKRAERSRQAAALRQAMAELPRLLPVFGMNQPLKGANNSTQYIAVVDYKSLISGQQDTIKIEVGLREPILTTVHRGSAKTILLDPVSDRPLLKPASLPCISKIEAFAEKFRAAMTRRDVAIRDFYDIDYALRRLDIHLTDTELVRLVRLKLVVPGNDSVDLSEGRLGTLRGQLETRLKPVLREKDYSDFDLERAIEAVIKMGRKV
jgi:predicted nucleotidyltransferase component of viral defense system